jgi:hypothetical protein
MGMLLRKVHSQRTIGEARRKAEIYGTNYREVMKTPAVVTLKNKISLTLHMDSHPLVFFTSSDSKILFAQRNTEGKRAADKAVLRLPSTSPSSQQYPVGMVYALNLEELCSWVGAFDSPNRKGAQLRMAKPYKEHHMIEWCFCS